MSSGSSLPSDRPRRSPLAAVVFLATLVVSALLAAWAMAHEAHNDAKTLAAGGRAVTTALQAAVDEAAERSRAVVALFGASQQVEESEFASFVGDLGYPAGMFGLGYIARVTDATRVAFEVELARDHPGTFIYQLEGLELVARGPAAVYYPIRFFESPEALPAWGFDAGSDPEFYATLERAMESHAPTASDFTWFPGRAGSDGFVIFHPVIAPDGSVSGAIAAAMDLSDMLAGSMADPGETPSIVDAASDDGTRQPAWEGVVVVGDRRWLVGLDGNGGSVYPLGAAVLAVGILTASALAMASAAVTERLRHRREVERLRTLDRQKNEFLAAVSHELRTPLTSVVGFADELASHPSLATADREAMVRIISDEARSMEGIVADLLVAARLQEGQTIGVSLERVADPAADVRDLSAIAEARVLDAHPGDTAVVADRGRFRQIVRNLLDNARRHGGPPVTVELRRRGATVELAVRDRGPGVPAEFRDRVFDKYLSLGRPDGRAPTTGIGLWVSRELARLMGGDLILSAASPGAEFVLVLPAADPAEAVGF